MSANEWCMWAVVSSPQTSPFTRTRIRASAASNSSAVTMHGPSAFDPSQSFALPGPMPTGALLSLDVARREVVPDRVAEDAAGCVPRLRVADAPPDHRRELELVVRAIGVGPP